MRVVASVEARMGASRLPGKMLADLGGQPAIARVVERLHRARSLDAIVLATTTNRADDVLVRWAEEAGLAVFRGSEDDVLGRVVGAHRSMGSDVVVEMTGDCVLTDPEVVDLAVETFRANDADVVTTTQKPCFPVGIDAQVFRTEDLAEVAAAVHDRAVREHVSLHFYDHPERYRVHHLQAPPRWRDPTLRLVLDYPEDLKLLQEVYAHLVPRHGPAFGLDEVLALVRAHPGLRDINAHRTEKLPR